MRFLDLISDGDIAAIAALISPTWTMEGGPPDLPAGREGLRVLFDHIGGVRQRWTIDDVIAEGDKVVVRATNHCEQDSFFGVPGRGIVQVFTATFTMQIVDGLIAKVWRNAADLQRLFQLGARILPRRQPPAVGQLGSATHDAPGPRGPGRHRREHRPIRPGSVLPAPQPMWPPRHGPGNRYCRQQRWGERAPMRLERRRRHASAGRPQTRRSFECTIAHPRPDHRAGPRVPPGEPLHASGTRPRRAA